MPWTPRSGAAPIYRTPQHKRARAALVKAFKPGDPCCLCGHPMYPPTRYLHADHLPGTTEYRGLAHGTAPCQVCGKRCNVRDGARRGRSRQGRRTPRPTRVTTLRW